VPNPYEPDLSTFPPAVRSRVDQLLDSAQLLEQLGPGDLRRMVVWANAQVALVRGTPFVDALRDAYAEQAVRPPPDGADPVAWVDQELAALTRALSIVMHARGALGHAG
jgi:hypothetical protein